MRREETLDWAPPWIGRRMLDPRRARCCAHRADAAPPARAAPRRRSGARREGSPADAEELFKVIDDRSSRGRSRRIPSPGWAQACIPTLGASEAVDLLWQDVVHVCRLDEPDPPAAWHERIEEIWQVASRLDELDLDALHFEGPGTDLTVGLLPSSRFAKEGGARRRAPASATCRTCRPRRCTRLPIPSGPKASSPRRSRSTSPARSSRGCGCASRAAAPSRSRPTRTRTRSARVRGRRRRLAARRGRARRPGEPDRQARSHLLHDAPRRERSEPPRARRRVSSPIADPADLPRIN